MSGVAFLYTGGLWFLFYCGRGWMSDLSRFPGYGSLSQCSGVWNWISSLWSAMECPVMSFEMSLCVRCDCGKPVC